MAQLEQQGFHLPSLGSPSPTPPPPPLPPSSAAPFPFPPMAGPPQAAAGGGIGVDDLPPFVCLPWRGGPDGQQPPPPQPPLFFFSSMPLPFTPDGGGGKAARPTAAASAYARRPSVPMFGYGEESEDQTEDEEEEEEEEPLLMMLPSPSPSPSPPPPFLSPLGEGAHGCAAGQHKGEQGVLQWPPHRHPHYARPGAPPFNPSMSPSPAPAYAAAASSPPLMAPPPEQGPCLRGASRAVPRRVASPHTVSPDTTPSSVSSPTTCSSSSLSLSLPCFDSACQTPLNQQQQAEHTRAGMPPQAPLAEKACTASRRDAPTGMGRILGEAEEEQDREAAVDGFLLLAKRSRRAL